jgi:uncharacterized nucleotidyltransferase DUF6036
MPPDLLQPWRGFLTDLDGMLATDVALHCLGGFVVTACYGLLRPTGDLDVLLVLPSESQATLATLAGQHSDLHKKHGVYLDVVTVATYPDNYEQRVTEVFPGTCRHIRLFALDPYDLALAKLERNLQRDRDDFVYLAETVPLDLTILKTRYNEEMRIYLGRPEREDVTLQLWIDIAEERRSS